MYIFLLLSFSLVSHLTQVWFETPLFLVLSSTFCSPFLLLNWFGFFEQNSEAMISIDMPAGPSEVLVIANKSSSARHVAADLLSQV